MPGSAWSLTISECGRSDAGGRSRRRRRPRTEASVQPPEVRGDAPRAIGPTVRTCARTGAPAPMGRSTRGAESGGEGGIRTRDGLPQTAFPVRRHSPLGDLSRGGRVTGCHPARTGPPAHDVSPPRGWSRRRRSRGPERAYPRYVSEDRRRRRTHRPPSRRAVVAERAGFEPAVLSHTAFRERHHQPLGHLSAGEDSRRDRRTPRPPGPPVGAWRAGEERLGFVAPDPAHDLDAARQPRVLGRRRTVPAAPSRESSTAKTSASTSLARSALDTHRARLMRREDRGVREATTAKPAGRFAQGDDDGVGGRVVRGLDSIVSSGDHGLIDDGDRGDRPLTALDGGLFRLG